jgi:hypothetical protein
MVHLEQSQVAKTFTEQMSILADYIRPFERMWPFYWLKAAAVRDPHASMWRLCYLGLSGRWSDEKPIQDVCDRGSAIIAISQLIDASRASEILQSLRSDGTIMLLPDIIASGLPGFSSLTSYWQESSSFQLPDVVLNVAEQAIWKYLYLFEFGSWTKETTMWFVDQEEPNELASEERIRLASQPDLDKRNLRDFESFTATRLGLGFAGSGFKCSIRDFIYNFDLPLALRIEPEIPDRSANSLPLTIYCRYPLTLENLKVSTGDIWLPNAEPLPINIEVSVDDGWSVGNIVVPYNCGKVWFEYELLSKTLPYNVSIPTPEDQMTEVLGSIYHVNRPDEGKSRWEKDLLENDGSSFEIALLNAISRFGVPVLFAGQLQTDGTATPGYDLIALNYAQRRAVLISAKGYTNNPSQEDCQKLLDAVGVVQWKLQGWYISGILACHATNNKLGLAKMRTDLQIWSREDLERLCLADRRGTIDPLLWRRPDLQGLATDWRSIYTY